MDDKFLVEQVLKGNQNAFKLLVVRYERPIFSFIKKFNLPPQRVEELAQDTFLKAYNNLSLYDSTKGTFATWLFTVAKNLVLSAKEKKQEILIEDQDLILVEVESANPETILNNKSEKETINRLISILPQPFKSAVMLSCINELSLQEVAAIEQCEIATIKTRIFRGKNLIRKMLFEGEQYDG